MVAWSFDVQYLRGYIFMNLKHFCTGPEHIELMFNFYIIRLSITHSRCSKSKFQYTKGQGVNKTYNFTNFKKSL